jgi:hypothetical protein
MPEAPAPGLIASGWQDFRRLSLLPIGAGAVQTQECRRAFYAGAIHLFHSLLRQMDGEREPTEADLAVLDGVKAEIEGYVDDLKAGRA